LTNKTTPSGVLYSISLVQAVQLEYFCCSKLCIQKIVSQVVLKGTISGKGMRDYRQKEKKEVASKQTKP